MLNKVFGEIQSQAVLVPTVYFFVLSHYLLNKSINVLQKPANVVVPLVLMVLLVPGMLLTFPAGSKGIFRSGQSTFTAVVVHTVVFAVVYALLRLNFSKNY